MDLNRSLMISTQCRPDSFLLAFVCVHLLVNLATKFALSTIKYSATVLNSICRIDIGFVSSLSEFVLLSSAAAAAACAYNWPIFFVPFFVCIVSVCISSFALHSSLSHIFFSFRFVSVARLYGSYNSNRTILNNNDNYHNNNNNDDDNFWASIEGLLLLLLWAFVLTSTIPTTIGDLYHWDSFADGIWHIKCVTTKNGMNMRADTFVFAG